MIGLYFFLGAVISGATCVTSETWGKKDFGFQIFYAVVVMLTWPFVAGMILMDNYFLKEEK